MIRDITLGQFFPGNSFVHRLDPRTKLILAIYFVVVLFLAKSLFSYLFLIAVTGIVIALTRVPIKFYLKGLRPLAFVLAFTCILNVLYPGVEPDIKFWIFSISYVGIFRAVFLSLRIIMMVILMSVLTYTTSPLVLMDGMERLLKPLTWFHIPVYYFSMMMTIAIRFIPTILEDADKIMTAQKSRGADFESGNLLHRVKALIPILIPLFVSSFRRADELATAMECRCYGVNQKRTRYTSYRFSMKDFLAVFLSVVILLIVLSLNYFKLGGSL